MIIRTNILITSVFHTESIRDCPELHNSKSFVKMSCMHICRYDCIKLQDTESMLLPLFQTIKNQFFSDVKSSALRTDRITRITDMSASSHISRVENIQPPNSFRF